MCKVPPPKPRAAPIVVGFSVRGLAEATAAAARPPLAADRFADHDCQLAAEQVVRLKQWGGNVQNTSEFLSELFRAGADAQSQVLLAGGMENWPELVELLHQHFTVLGPTADQLRLLRSPQRWQRWAEQSSIAFPETFFPQAQDEHSQSASNWLIKPLHLASGWGQPLYVKQPASNWLSKPLRSAGGTAIKWSSHASPEAYWQRHVAGRSLGVYCVLHRDGSAQLLGATESISATQWPGPSEFIYRGSLGPIRLPQHHCRQIVELCRLIQRETELLGWLQLDFIEDHAGDLWLLELNPRWAAGMEVLFLAGINPVEHHCRAWQAEADAPGIASADATPTGGPAASTAAELPCQREISFGKAIVYASRELVLTRQCIESLHNLPRDNFADLPSHQLIADGQSTHVVSGGEPLLTVRASGPHDTLLEQLARLRETALATLA